MTRRAALLAVVALLAGCEQAGRDAPRSDADACEGAPSSSTLGHAANTSVITTREPYPCGIEASPTALVLRAASSDTLPDPGRPVAIGANGWYYTNARQSSLGLVLAWDSAGVYRGSYGSRGFGPGEFAGMGTLGVFPGRGDSLYVVDDQNRWSVLDAELAFRRTFRGDFSGRDPRAMHATPRGILTTGRVVSGATGNYFHLMGFDGEPISSFGEVPAAESYPAGSIRISAYAGGNTFWVAPVEGSGGTLTLEEWTLDGEHVRTLRREADWLPRDGYPAGTDSSEPVLPHYPWLAVDSRGLLWVSAAVRDARWRPVPRDQRMNMLQELYDVYVEVIDPVAGVVLASARIDDPSPDHIPTFALMLSGTRKAYRPVLDADGFSSIELRDVRLVPARTMQAGASR